ncbi:DUF5990 family protein [Flavitalea sp.]|nr:DUF5990 family protein [Flavitalea sp.]
MKLQLPIRIILEAPPAGVDYGIQKGSGNNYETIEKQRSDGRDLQFNFSIMIKNTDPSSPDFSGPFVQGPAGERFIYIDIGTTAGQFGTSWSRRLKIPLKNISMETPDVLSGNSTVIMVTKVPGTGKDGGPNCATVKPFAGWHFINNDPITK